MASRLARILGIVMLAVAGAPAGAQVLERGFYFEVAVGKSTFNDVSQTAADQAARNFFDDFDLPVQTLTSALEDTDRSYALISGYRFNPWFSMEAGYFRLGAFQYTSSGTVSDGGTILPSQFNLSYRAKGFMLGGTASLPLGNYFELRGRAGVSDSETRLKLYASVDGDAVSDKYSESSQDFYYGAGFGVLVFDYYRIGVDWMRHEKLGRSNGNGSTDVDNVMLSFTYQY